MITVNGVVIPTPKSFKVSISDIDGESNRNAQGDMCRDRIAVKRKLELEWGPLTQSESSLLLTAVENVFFEVVYPDPKEGSKTITAYVGDRTTPMLKCIDGIPKWEGLSMNFIER